MDELTTRYYGVPLYWWLLGGGLLVGVAYHFYRNQQKAKAAAQQLQSSGGTLQSTANPATQNPVALDVNSAYVQGITDQYGNLLPQFTWPYNQLALPYNWGPGVNSYYNYLSAQSGSFVGSQYTPTSGGI
jgi:hypothetical protein